ncbi:MAG TPA: glucodextranase DOMON-like domain-containing protein [Chloroflexota bacterium]
MHRIFTSMMALGLLLGGLAPAAGAAPAVVPAISATDGPGAVSHFDLARKDCLGTARNTSSRVWFTLADGVLSDVYYPTIDNTNVETLQFIVTDGATFTDLQTRDTTYEVRLLDKRGQALDCQVRTTARNGKYRIITDYVTDPGRDAVVMQVRFEPLIGKRKDYQLYARLDPTINGNGGGGAANAGADSGTVDTSGGHGVPVACDPVTDTNSANRDYAQPICAALDAATPFVQVSNGFAGQPSDGLRQLDATHALNAVFTDASSGNLVQTVQLDLSRNDPLVLALGFGADQATAVQTARLSAQASFDGLVASYEQGWHTYDAGLDQPPSHVNGIANKEWRDFVDRYFLSANVVKASEDKTFPGALVASLASPWGQAVSAGDPNNTYFGSYREIFARDAYEAWTGLLVAGDLATARDVVLFLFERQQLADGSLPRNSLVNGKPAPDTFNTQLDECAYPILMAFQLHMNNAALYRDHIKPAANFIISHGPSFGPERWEEQSGFSPSTIAAEVAGLIAAADIAEHNGDSQSAQVWRGVADDWQRSLAGWAVTTNGPLANHPYFIRLSKTGDPNAAISYNVGNGGPTLDQRAVIDAGFLELVRLGLEPANDVNIVRSMPIVDATIKSSTEAGLGFHRYNGDGYGDGDLDGHPWAPSGRGSGHLWPPLNNERGEYGLAAGDRDEAIMMLRAMFRFGGGVGLTPEQVWENRDLPRSPFGTDPTLASIGFQRGQPAGSASPLTWSAGVYVRLLQDFVANKLLEQPENTTARYIQHEQGQTALSVTAPADASAVTASPVVVTGTSVPGTHIFVAATNVDGNSETTTAEGVTGSDGKFEVSVAVSGGTTVLNVVAVGAGGATGHATRIVVFDFVPGTLLFDFADPDADDNGPGNYAYPTSDDFHAGAFDLQQFQLFDDGTNFVFRVRTRDLSPTFGSPLGAQLIDVYVHDPLASTTSTAASFAQRNYTIATGGAWSRLLEVQGFGQRYLDATGNTVGTIRISANAISRFITFSVPKVSLGGQPTAGWGFTVVLTGQDGFSPDQARGFAPTPQAFQFGVCAAPSSDAHCTFDPNRVPKVMDVLTPAGVPQSDEVDYTVHQPIVLQPVLMP